MKDRVISQSNEKERTMMSLDTETPPITPQQYEVLHGGGAEAAEIAKQHLSRRRFLRRSLLAVWGLSAAASVAGALDMLNNKVPHPDETTRLIPVPTVQCSVQ